MSAHTYTSNQLLRRVVFAWRWQLAGVAAALLVLAAVSWMAAQRVVRERDRAQQAEQAGQVALASAQRSRAHLQVRQAVVLAQRGAWPEAAVLAADALGNAGDPATLADARGVLIAAGATGPTAVTGDDALPDCQKRYVDPAGVYLLCLTASDTSLWQIKPVSELWRRAISADYGVIFTDVQLVYLRQPGALQGLDLATGATRWQGLASSATVPIQRSVGNDVLQISGDFVLVTTPNGAQHSWQLCPPTQMMTAVHVHERRALAVCPDGQLRACDLGEPCTSVGALPLPARDISAIASDGDGIWLASTRGQIVRCVAGLHDCSPPVTAVAGMIRKLQVAGPWLMALADRGEVALLTATALEPVLTTLWGAPSDAHLSNRQLVIVGERLRTYELPVTPQIAQWTAQAGTSLASFDVAGGLVVTGGNDGRVAVRKVSDGSELWSASPASSVIKAVALQEGGEAALVSTTDNALIRIVSSTSMADVPVINVRRLVSVRRAGAAWMVGATYGQGVFAWATTAAGLAPQQPASRLGGPTEDWLDLAATADRSGALGIESPGTSVWQLDFSHKNNALAYRRVRLAALGTWRNVAAASVDGDYAVADESRIAWFRQSSSKAVAQVIGPARICDLAVTADGDWLAAGLIDGSVAVYRTRDLALMARTHLQRERVAEVLTEPQGLALWAGSWDGTLRRFDLSQLRKDDVSALRGATTRWKLLADQWSSAMGQNP